MEVVDTYAGVLRASAARFADLEALADGDVRFTFGQLLTDVRAVAAALIVRGIRQGDRVAVWAPNSHWWVRFSEAVHYIGGVVVPINSRYRAIEAREILSRTKARAILIDDRFLGFDYLEALGEAFIDEGVATLDDLEFVVDVSADSSRQSRTDCDIFGWEGFVATGTSVAPETVETAADAVRGSDLGDILFTSGTTGQPKGVAFVQGAVIALYRDFGRIWGLRPGDRYLLSLPMFHSGGFKAGVLTSLIHGAAIVPLAVFDAVEMMRLIERERVSILNGPPTVLYALLDDARRVEFDLSTLRLAATGAATVPVTMVERVQKELPFEHFITAYGMTETYGVATMCNVGDSKEMIANTNGRALPNVLLKVVDADGAELPAGQAGELLVKAPNVTPGYWREIEQSSAAVVDGWLSTGDIGTLDEAGYLKITDRLKDLFVVGGFNVSPAEVEQTLARHPDVREVSVIGVPDARLGEVARAFIIPGSGSTPDEAEIIAWCRERLANFKVPRMVVLVEQLPRNTQGKVMKTELRASFTSVA
ncbi:AMP-binding protein [Microbacterium sp. A84]|uniref:AMP-binding protein n=1 Tax=Microbacterium sp. A84 TaxID=3450715 RepID=UPI003F422D18